MSDLNDIVAYACNERLSRGGFLHEDVMTVTGKTLAENLKNVPTLAEVASQNVIFSLENPYAEPGNHIGVLTGNLARESAVMKLSGKDIHFEGPAVVFDTEFAALKPLLRATLKLVMF